MHQQFFKMHLYTCISIAFEIHNRKGHTLMCRRPSLRGELLLCCRVTQQRGCLDTLLFSAIGTQQGGYLDTLIFSTSGTQQRGDLGRLIFSIPKPKDSPNHFDFGIVVYTNPKPKEGPNHFDFGIVIYTTPKAERRPESIRPWNRDLHESQSRKKAQTIPALES